MTLEIPDPVVGFAIGLIIGQIFIVIPIKLFFSRRTP